MTTFSRSILSLALILITANDSFSQVNSIQLSIIENALDSIGPWNYQIENIDSLDSNGRVETKLKRQWGGTDWRNDHLETFQYDLAGNTIEHIISIWNGSTFSKQIKIEKIFDGLGHLVTEITYQYEQNVWLPSTKHEYSYDQQSGEQILTSYASISGAWTPTDQHIRSYNSNTILISELHKSWNGSAWDIIQYIIHSYNSNQTELNSDSVFYLSTGQFFLSHTEHYAYTNNGTLNQKISRDFYSYSYSDQDTSYIQSEIDFEYSLSIITNASGQTVEQSGMQTRGSSQNWTFSKTNYTYDLSGRLTEKIIHAGSNINESFIRESAYYYEPLNAGFIASPATCQSCPTGSIEVTAWGGVPPYEVKIQTASVNGMTVYNLSVGTYNICVLDAVGNEICREIQIADISTGLNNIESDKINFTLFTATYGPMLIVETNAPQDLNLSIFDLTGKLISEKIIKQGKNQFSLTGLPNGKYFYHALNSTTNIRGGFIKISN